MVSARVSHRTGSGGLRHVARRLVHEKRGNGAPGCHCLERVLTQTELELDILVGAIQDHHRDLAVRAERGRGLQAAGAGANAVGARLGPGLVAVLAALDCRREVPGTRNEVLREVADIVVLRVQVNLLLFRIGDDGSVAHVAHVIWPASLVQQQVPIDPTDGTSIQIANDVVGVALSKPPIRVRLHVALLPHAPLVRGLAGQQQQMRVFPVRRGDPVEEVATVPMEGGAIDVLGDVGVGHRCVHVLPQHVLAVVEDEQLQLGMLALDGWPQLVLDEVRLLLRGQDASLPRGGVAGLVLDGERPNRRAGLLVVRDPSPDVLRPWQPRLLLEALPAGTLHLPARLHPRRRAPGRGEEPQAPRWPRGDVRAVRGPQGESPARRGVPCEAGLGCDSGARRADGPVRRRDQVLAVRTLERHAAVLVPNRLEDGGIGGFRLLRFQRAVLADAPIEA
mmetsp:Transcript_25227/g.75794  ORF Transcript_25227/g.75794 Transcript_25227/m.75794 type:complete len:450 (+) Transcript_25227:1-1350(+)